MSITGKNSKSIRKVDVKESKTLAQGFTKLVFAHKADLGDTLINLSSLTTPTEMSALGFTNPSPSRLTEARLFQFKTNLTLISSLRGALMQDLSYRVNSNSSIKLEFEAQDGEIFTGIIDANPVSGIQVIDAKQAVAKGDLADGNTDFAIGFSTSTLNEDIIVIRNGLVQTRNTNNSSTVEDGNYFLVDSGSGYSSLVRFNTAASGSDDSILVVSLGGIVESPTNSTWDEIQKVQGQIDALIPTVADLAGVAETDFQAAPNDVDLRQFGAIVTGLLDMEVPYVTEWEPFVPTGTWSTNSTYTGRKKRVGDTAYYEVRIDLDGAPDATSLFINQPANEEIDNGKTVSETARDLIRGYANMADGGTVYSGGVAYATTSTIRIAHWTVSGSSVNSWSTVTQASPFTFGNGDSVYVEYNVPIQGWKATRTLREHLQAKGIL